MASVENIASESTDFDEKKSDDQDLETVEADANNALSNVRSNGYKDAYVKYSGEYIGNQEENQRMIKGC